MWLCEINKTTYRLSICTDICFFSNYIFNDVYLHSNYIAGVFLLIKVNTAADTK